MSTASASDTAPGTGAGHFPAYGPIEAALGVLMFYLVVDRATPTVVAVLWDVMPSVAASTVTTGLAIAIWLVLLLSLLDQGRRQLAALGVIAHEEVERESRGPALLSEELGLGYLVLLILGWLVVAYAFQPALDTAVELISVVAYQDLAAFDVSAFVTMVVFFVAYGLVTRALDRLLVGGLRMALAD